MLEFQKKKRLRKILYSRMVIVFLIILLVIIGKATWTVRGREIESKKNLEKIQAQLAALERRHQNLSNEIEKLGTTKGVEAEIRDKYRVAKDGEEMIVLVDKVIESTNTPPQKKGFWGAIGDFFVNLF